MSKLKISQEQMIGVPELNRFQEFLSEEGFRKLFVQQSSGFGLVKNETLDPNFNNGKVIAGTNSGTIKILGLNAFDSNGRFLLGVEIDNLAVPEGQDLFVKATYSPTALEVGTVSIDENGTLTGIGTSFLSTLRQKPEFPSKIRLESVQNFLDYEVLEVVDDNNAILIGSSFVAEENLRYSIVGTFTPGFVPNPADKLIYEFDSVVDYEDNMTVSEVNTNVTFTLAKVRNDGGIVTIEDKREKVWSTKSDYENHKMDYFDNPYIGVEAVKFDNQFTDLSSNIVEIAWGLRSSNWSFSSSLREFVITNGQGGVLKRDAITTDFTPGSFNGWRVYYQSGKYSKIINSIIEAGAIKITVDKLNPSDLSLSQEIFICPDVEEVVLRVRSDDREISQVENRYVFPVFTPLAKLKLLVPSDFPYNYNLAYAYKNNNEYSDFKLLPDSNYLAESSFDANGILKSDPVQWEIKPYVSDPVEGYIQLIPNPNSYRTTIDRIDVGDKLGARLRELNNASPLITIAAGSDETNQYIQNNGEFVLSTNHIFNVLSANAKNGNTFTLYFRGPFQDGNGSFTFQIRQDYVNVGNPGTLLYQFTTGELQSGNAIFTAVYQSGAWILRRINESNIREDVGEIRMFSGTTSGKFNSSGLGISSRWLGWAVCNGQNGTPDLRQRFVAGYDPASAGWAMGNTGGANQVSLTQGQLPPHTHSTTLQVLTRGTGGSNTAGLPGQGGTPSNVVSSSTGSGDAHENRPAFYALAFVIKIN
jgi:hypothetical protein